MTLRNLTCARCGKVFTADDARPGPLPMYCSESCKTLASRERRVPLQNQQIADQASHDADVANVDLTQVVYDQSEEIAWLREQIVLLNQKVSQREHTLEVFATDLDTFLNLGVISVNEQSPNLPLAESHMEWRGIMGEWSKRPSDHLMELVNQLDAMNQKNREEFNRILDSGDSPRAMKVAFEGQAAELEFRKQHPELDAYLERKDIEDAYYQEHGYPYPSS